MKKIDDNLLLNAALDGELGIVQQAELETRLANEAALKKQWEQQVALRSAIRAGATYHEAPAPLRARIAQTLAAHTLSPAADGLESRRASAPALADAGRRSWALATAAALGGILVGGGLSWRLAMLDLRATDAAMRSAEDAMAGHVRATLTDRLTDVASSDQHTVRPWLSAHFAYASPVPDLSAQGYELLGARRDVVDAQTVAVLVYRTRKHVISVFMHPLTRAGSAGDNLTTVVRGFNVVAAAHGELRLYCVSDLNARELNDFAQLFEAAS